ncbi:MAG: group II intron maturase-specific domain-containing protein, partial [Candidatus Brocadia sp.]
AKLNPVIRGHVNYFRLGDVKNTYRKSVPPASLVVL